MTVRRSAFVMLGIAILASFAAGWWTGALAKSQASEHAPIADANRLAENPVAEETRLATNPLAEETRRADDTYEKKIVPFVKKYCLGCHNSDKAAGGLTLEGYQTEAQARRGRKDWLAVQEILAAGKMPPPKKMPQPAKEERDFVVNWIERSLTKVDCGLAKDPGRVTIRRLNRAEYNNTIRDLCGVDFKPAEDFPADDVGYGFDNIGDVLSFQPILLEKYMSAADRILDEALKLPIPPPKDVQKRFPQQISAKPGSAKKTTKNAKGRDVTKITFDFGFAVLPELYNFPAEADYVLRFKGWGTKQENEFPKVAIRVAERDGTKEISTDLKTFTVDAPETAPHLYEVKGHFKEGGKRISIHFVNPIEEKSKPKRLFGLEMIEIEGPINPVPKPDPASVKLLLVARPNAAMPPQEAAEQVLASFARRAYRRPVKPEETQRLLKLFDVAERQGEPFEKAIRLPMKAVLCSPNFLYRIEDDPKDPNAVRTLNDFEFATRLSYFLWSSMPDEELFKHAAAGDLRSPAVLEGQVRRMLKDSRSRALSENFAGQWLQLRNIKSLAPDKGYYPKWDEKLKEGMIGEAEAFFEYVVQNDRSILEFLDADYAFVNERMADHYGIKDVVGSRFRKVKLPDSRRGGILTMASTLTVTSNPTRTSPVKRGKWILENVLGTPPPPPAPDVPELPPTGQLKGTLRQQMEQHRANPSCAVCHAKLDPLGFGLENFDGIGGWRTVDNKKPIDSSGVLPGGEKFNGPAELRKIL
ncbi:MAG TPA: DUF1592 domain-containing protein, partial [Urbifossiella sp.]